MTRRLQPSETGEWRPEPVMSPGYWQERLRLSDGEIHRAIFSGSLGQYEREVAPMREAVLAAGVGESDSVLDVGCGWGVLLGWLEESGWRGDYLGVDVTPEFIRAARPRHPGREFLVGDARELTLILQGRHFDWAIAVWMREMVEKNLGRAAWEQVEAQMWLCAARVLVVR